LNKPGNIKLQELKEIVFQKVLTQYLGDSILVFLNGETFNFINVQEMKDKDKSKLLFDKVSNFAKIRFPSYGSNNNRSAGTIYLGVKFTSNDH
jgi:ATP sulfurylase